MAMQGTFDRRPAARPADLADYGPPVLFALYFIQALIFIACGPDFVAFGQKDFYYRVYQVLWGATALVMGIWLTQRFNLRLSGTAKTVGVFLFLSAVIQYASQAFEYRPDYKIESFQTTLLFLTMFLGMDLLSRRFTFAEFARHASWMAIATIIISAIHIAFFATRLWDRAWYFGLHPNLGGEVMFAAVALTAFNRIAWLRYLCYALAFFVLLELQARAAILACAVLIAIIEVPLKASVLRAFLAGGFAVLAAACLVILASPELGEKITTYITEDVFMTSDPHRGAGTGLVGRADTWVMAYEKLVERPLTGTGLNLSGETIMGDPIHNGYIKDLAEYGIPGMFLNILLLASIPIAFRSDWRRGAIVLAGNIVYFFNARNVNLSVFPMILWLSILPWLPPTAPNPRTQQAR